MKIKGRRRYEMACELAKAMTKKMTVNELMMNNKRDFLKLWISYCNFCEADNALGDCNP